MINNICSPKLPAACSFCQLLLLRSSVSDFIASNFRQWPNCNFPNCVTSCPELVTGSNIEMHSIAFDPTGILLAKDSLYPVKELGYIPVLKTWFDKVPSATGRPIIRLVARDALSGHPLKFLRLSCVFARVNRIIKHEQLVRRFNN